MSIGQSILAGRDRMKLENGMELRLLSALEVLQARREAGLLAEKDGERALCSNACLVARALEQDGMQVFENGRQVLSGLTVEEIVGLARKWGEFNQSENPGVTAAEAEVEAVKKN